jgi:citrate lyase subunit beta/citryl-CoA lyase
VAAGDGRDHKTRRAADQGRDCGRRGRRCKVRRSNQGERIMPEKHAVIVRPRRSVLYLPGTNVRALDKARTLPVDALILDLEDSVAPDMKAVARDQVAAALRAGGFGAREVVVRVNTLDGPWGDDDLAAVAAAGPDAVALPKVDAPDMILDAADRLAEFGRADIALWAMIETPAGVLAAPAIAAAGRGVAALVVGTNDLAKETRARQVKGRAPMLAWLSQIVLAARAAGIDVLDGVFNNLDDEAGFADECLQGLELGMDGKTLIHPKQIAIANATFAPNETEIAAARRILEAFAAPENHNRGVIALDGRMVERLHAEMAARTVALAEAIAARR